MKLMFIDETGLHLPDYPAVLDYIHAQFRSIYGQDVYLEPDSQDGQLAAVFAAALHDTYALAGSVYQAFSPATSQGAGLSRMVKINGLGRQTASYSTVELRLVGQAGTIISNGIAKDAQQRLWLLPERVLVPVEGEVFVTATAEDRGDIRAGANEITAIATPTRGWQSVNNPQSATPGRKVEADAELRRRQSVSTALPSLTVLEGTVGAVASLEGVSRWRAYENDQNETDANGVPGHSIALVVEGGDTQAIAQAIAHKKTPGTGTYGSTAVRVVDDFGVPNTIRFTRPTVVDLQVRISIKALPGYVSTTGTALRQAVADYINALPIGEDVLLVKLYVPANLHNTVLSASYDILSLTVGRIADTPAAANVDIDIFEAAALELENIHLEEK